MTPEQIFSIANLVALAGWILLAVLPGRVWVSKVVTAVLIPALLAVVYVTVLATHRGTLEGGFGSLAQVALLFSNPWALLAGWVHYLAFDLFVGSWEVRDSRVHGIPHWFVLPCLFLTFMFGPAGWLLYLTVRVVRTHNAAIA
jgi:ABA DEFICIENT 4-like